MASASGLGLTERAWKAILDENPREVDAVMGGGLWELSSADIKAHREPRLMTKFDSGHQMPAALRRLGVCVIANTRRSYVLGRFDVFERLESVGNLRPTLIELPEYETLRVEDISSESNAINALRMTGALGHFVEDDRLEETFNGRMGTGDFDFDIDMRDGGTSRIAVRRAQMEIDGGFESGDTVVIMEAKNVFMDDFNLRQLYYPFRCYEQCVTKPVRLVFSQYTNMEYHLYEYEFQDVDSISSARCVRKGVYAFPQVLPTVAEVLDAIARTRVAYDDHMDRTPWDFPQANSFDKIFALAERLRDEPDGLDVDEVAEFLGMVPRQGYYYASAGVYVGLLVEDGDGNRMRWKVSRNGLLAVGSGFGRRVLWVVELLCAHELFKRLLPEAVRTNRTRSVPEVAAVMLTLNVVRESRTLPERRAGTVNSWTRWVLERIRR